jgi:hypothetical protein
VFEKEVKTYKKKMMPNFTVLVTLTSFKKWVTGQMIETEVC